MAHKRPKGSKWEFIVKREGLLPKPLSMTFSTEEEGDDYCRRLEALLDRGIVPTEHQIEHRVTSLNDLIYTYLRDAAVKPKDVETLSAMRSILEGVTLERINVSWVDGFITRLKREEHLAPATIRAKVGALARCTDWGVRQKHLIMPDHPFRTLPNGYAAYTEKDAALAGSAKVDEERDRRLNPGEFEKTLEVIRTGTLARKQRPYTIADKQAVEDIFTLGLESAMRLTEMNTLGKDQVRLSMRTAFLTKTKNGDKRQVPLSSVALKILERRLAETEGTEIFPWWVEGNSVKLASNFVSKLFANIFEDAGFGDLRFHDLRHEATSRLFEKTKFSAEEIMKITGHKNHKMMMRYLNLRGSYLADGLW